MRKELILVLILAVVLFNFIVILKTVSFNLSPSTGHVTSMGTLILTIFSNPYVILIDNPQNKSYSFDIGQNYTINLDVSSQHNYSKWYYKLEDTRHNTLVFDYIQFTPNTTFNSGRWNNRLTVLGSDPTFNNTQSVEFYVSVPNSAPIIRNLSEEILVCEDSSLSYYFNATDIDEDNLTSSLSSTNPFYTTATRYNLTNYLIELYSGILNKSRVGNYFITAYLSDSEYLDSKAVTFRVIEINHAPNITYFGVQTLWTSGDNSTLNKQVEVNDLESGDSNSGNLSFNISFSGQRLFNVSSNGVISFVANSSVIGQHNVTVCVRDNGLSNPHQNISYCGQNGTNLSSCSNFSLTITNENRAPEIVSSYPSASIVNINSLVSYLFNISARDPDGTTPDIYWYLDGDLVLTNLNNISYSFLCGLTQSKLLGVEITDGLLNASRNWTLNVNTPSCSSGEEGTGGGGGGGGSSCTSKLACDEWEICTDRVSTLSRNDTLKILDQCSKLGLRENCGFQRRMCRDLNFCSKKETLELQACHYTLNPNCYDGIQNCHDGKCEVLADCGGSCIPCGTCSNGIYDIEEEGIDCGGPCPERCIEKAQSSRLFKLQNILIIILFIILIGIIFLIYRALVLKGILNNREKELHYKYNP